MAEIHLNQSYRNLITIVSVKLYKMLKNSRHFLKLKANATVLHIY